MSDCQDCSQPVLTAHVTDEVGNEWHVRCLDSAELDDLEPSDIQTLSRAARHRRKELIVFRIRSESRQAITDHQAAKDELQRVSRRDQTETPEFNAANQNVIDTEQRVSWFRR